MKYIDTKLVAPIVLIALILAAVASITQGGVGGVPCSDFAIAGSEELVKYGDQPNPIEMFNATLCGTQGHAYLISVSSECILVTDTKIKSKDLALSHDEDQASINVYVEVIDTTGRTDPMIAYPGTVTFAERTQYLEGKLSGAVVCTTDPVTQVETCELVDEEVRLRLNTTSANTFNFLLTGLESTVYNVRVMAELDIKDDSPLPDDHILAAIGDRTLIVQEVNLANDHLSYP